MRKWRCTIPCSFSVLLTICLFTFWKTALIIKSIWNILHNLHFYKTLAQKKHLLGFTLPYFVGKPRSCIFTSTYMWREEKSRKPLKYWYSVCGHVCWKQVDIYIKYLLISLFEKYANWLHPNVYHSICELWGTYNSM